MTLDELQDALLAADPAAVLVAPHLLSHVVKRVRKLGSQFAKIPHRKSLVVDRSVLFRHIEQDELHLDGDRLLPPTVILLAQPSQERLSLLGRQVILLEYWQRLFHANVHVSLEKRFPPSRASAEEARARVEEIGRTEMEEVRDVLLQESMLFPAADDRELYIEFAAVYLELRFFLPKLIEVYFPGLRDQEQIDRLLARDIEAGALFQTTRLPGAPDPVTRPDAESDQPNETYWKLLRGADRAAKAGNSVRAALFRTQAAAVAPPTYAAGTHTEARADLEKLATRLQTALRLSDGETQEWLRCFPPLVEHADQGHWTVEARLLYDLQKVCADHEREIYTLDVVEWVMSAGRRPIQRPLPSQRFVRTIRHLRSAAQRLTTARVPAGERVLLSRLLQASLHQSEARLRARFRPVLTDALADVGLQPANAPERTALHKIVEELLDRIVEYGFLTFSDLRDALSRNDLKLADLGDPQEFARGDPLLRLDRRLATMLDGVYRPSEVYLRWLQRVTSLNFGTKVGRAITRYFTMPFGGALVVLEGMDVVKQEVDHWFYGAPKEGSGALFGPVSLLQKYFEQGGSFPYLGMLTFVLLGFAFLGLIHLANLRRRFRQVGAAVYRGARRGLFELPAELLPLETLRAAWRSWPGQLFAWFFLRPLVAFGIVWGTIAWCLPDWRDSPLRAGLTFLVLLVVLNSRLGRATSLAMRDAVMQLVDWLRAGLVQNLIRMIVQGFKKVTDLVEYVLYGVDEWLRFRGGESRLSMVARLLLTLVWFPISYVIRLYVVVLIEPGFNPLKFPISSVAAKFVYPVALALGLVYLDGRPGLIEEALKHVMPGFLAFGVAWMTYWLLPDAFGFLFWETKENWKLYSANRNPTLRSATIGSHGETMVQLLRPGFHSGTLPKLYARLRHAELAGYRSGIWRSARVLRHRLEDVEESVCHFVERELLVLLQQSAAWQNRLLNVGAVTLAGNRIAVEVCNAEFHEEPLWLTFEHHSGWLMAGISRRGWLTRVNEDQARAFGLALAGLYKFAGIDLVREQLQAGLPVGTTAYELSKRGLVLWQNQHDGPVAAYDLGGDQEPLPPRPVNGRPVRLLPVLDARQVVFSRVPLQWQDWVESWEQESDGKPVRELFVGLLGPLR